MLLSETQLLASRWKSAWEVNFLSPLVNRGDVKNASLPAVFFFTQTLLPVAA